MEKLYAEIPASLSPSPTAATAADTPYLSACISEALRLFPPIVTPFPRTVSAPGLQLGQYFIPGGYPDIEVFAATAHMGLSREVFGADAAEWRPERWLEIGPEEKRRWERSLFAWGYSSRVCLGKPVAEVEMLLAVKRFVECFVAEEVKLEDLKSFGMRKHKGLKMKLRRRTA